MGGNTMSSVDRQWWEKSPSSLRGLEVVQAILRLLLQESTPSPGQ